MAETVQKSTGSVLSLIFDLKYSLDIKTVSFPTVSCMPICYFLAVLAGCAAVREHTVRDDHDLVCEYKAY